MLAENNNTIDEELLPNALDIRYEAEKGQQIAEEIEEVEIARGRRLQCYCAIGVFIFMCVSGLIVYFLVK